MTLSYQQALDFIFDYVDYEKQARFTYDAATLDLSRMKRLLALLGEPLRRFRSVHIAGTKGKGSTAAMSEAILRAAGFRTGLYTSPHLHTFRERIRVDGQLLSREEVVTLVEQCRPAIEAVEGITTFEIITALGFLHFAQQEVEWAILETGLGGRLDATNVVLPEITAITALSLDHTYLLGDTLALIAGEKAGIIKPGVPLVCAPQATEAMQVVEAVCRERQAELILVGQDWSWERLTADLTGQTLYVREQTGGDHAPVMYENLHIPFLGRHQLLNTTMVVALMETLRRRGVEIPEAAIGEGLAQTRWPGRLEILRQRPFVVVDGAHNGDSARRLVAAMKELFPHRRLILVFGALTGHSVPDMLEALLPAADEVILTRTNRVRAVATSDLLREVHTRHREAERTETVTDALERALALAGPEDLICATGSLSVVGEAREALADALPPDDWAHEAEPVLAVH
jgi:dihydrofolate synthase/folylpolyglutamate synthase